VLTLVGPPVLIEEISALERIPSPFPSAITLPRLLSAPARSNPSGVAVSFVAPEERGLLKAVERFIRKTIRVESDHPFRNENAERKVGAGDSLPQAPWMGKAKQGKDGRNKRRRKVNFAGRRQADFRKKG
jgi:superfamily II DNA/RNA helicase